MPLDLDELPVVERIVQTLVGRIARVRLAECFNVELVQVVRPSRVGGYSPQHGTAVVEQLDPDIDDELSVPGNPPLIAYKQPLTVALYVLQSDTDTTPLDLLVNLFRADVEQAITQYPDPRWQEFDGLALHAGFDKPLLFGKRPQGGRLIGDRATGDGQFAGITLKLNVIYRTPLGDPYTVG